MNDGIIYPCIRAVYHCFDKFSAVECLKRKFSADQRTTTDRYIIVKWVLTLGLFSLPFECCWYQWLTSIIVFYLWFYNLFIYVKYHLVQDHQSNDPMSSKRRLINVGQAFLYNNLAYAFFYAITFKSSFKMDQSQAFEYCEKLGFFLYSMSNSLASTNYAKFSATDAYGDTLIISQLFASFIFIATLISSTINRMEYKDDKKV